MKSYTQHPYTRDGLMHWWVGMVESRADPMQLGRVQVRIVGYHTDDKELIPTEELAWAAVLNPVNSASVSGVGFSPTGTMEGTMVAGFWGDYPECQVPIVMGTFNLQESFGGGLGGNIANLIGDLSNIGPGNMNPTGDGPPWLRIARGELGTKENTSPTAHNPEVLKYSSDWGWTTDDGGHPWCSAFVYWCNKQAGLNVSGITGGAQSHLRAAAYEKLGEPIYGCVAIYKRGPKPENGHVGFWVGREGGRDKLLGGNQSNKVSIAPQSTAKLMGYRWPVGQPKELSTAKASPDDTGSSGNEFTGSVGSGQ